MAKKLNLKVVTKAGEFTRTAATLYTHCVVWASPRAKQTTEAHLRAGTKRPSSGVDARWMKDRGFATTWHYGHASALKAAQAGYKWDPEAMVAGIFEVVVSN